MQRRRNANPSLKEWDNSRASDEGVVAAPELLDLDSQETTTPSEA